LYVPNVLPIPYCLPLRLISSWLKLGKELDGLALAVESFLDVKLWFEPNKLVLVVEPLLDVKLRAKLGELGELALRL